MNLNDRTLVLSHFHIFFYIVCIISDYNTYWIAYIGYFYEILSHKKKRTFFFLLRYI